MIRHDEEYKEVYSMAMTSVREALEAVDAAWRKDRRYRGHALSLARVRLEEARIWLKEAE